MYLEFCYDLGFGDCNYYIIVSLIVKSAEQQKYLCTYKVVHYLTIGDYGSQISR